MPHPPQLHLLPLRPIRNNLPKHIRHTPNSRAQTGQLYNLARIDEQIHIQPKLPNIPIKHLQLRHLRHDLLHRQLPQNRLNNTSAPLPHILRNPLQLNHHTLHAHINKPPRGIDNSRQIRHAHALQLPSLGITTHPKLDPQLQLRRQPSLLNPHATSRT